MNNFQIGSRFYPGIRNFLNAILYTRFHWTNDWSWFSFWRQAWRFSCWFFWTMFIDWRCRSRGTAVYNFHGLFWIWSGDHKPASLDLCCFKTIYLRRTLKVGECWPGNAGSFVETSSYPLTTYKYINFYIMISAMYVQFLLSSLESTVTIQQGDFDRGYTCNM